MPSLKTFIFFFQKYIIQAAAQFDNQIILFKEHLGGEGFAAFQKEQ